MPNKAVYAGVNIERWCLGPAWFYSSLPISGTKSPIQ